MQQFLLHTRHGRYGITEWSLQRISVSVALFFMLNNSGHRGPKRQETLQRFLSPNDGADTARSQWKNLCTISLGVAMTGAIKL